MQNSPPRSQFASLTVNMNTSTTPTAAACAAPNSKWEPTPSDCQILEALGHRWQDISSLYRKRCLAAARRIFNKTQQWPWEWAADILPRKAWGYNLLEDIARILAELDKTSTEANRHSNAHNLREFLRKRALERNENDPHLTATDARKAMEHFDVKRKARKTAETPNETELDRDEGKAGDCQNASDGCTEENGNQQGGTQNELDAASFTSPVTTGNRKRPGEASDNPQPRKNSRRDGPVNPDGNAPQHLGEGLIHYTQRVLGETSLPWFLSPILEVIQDKGTMARTAWDDCKCKLNKARSLVKERETSLDEALAHRVSPRMVQELQQTRDKMVDAKKTIEQAKAFFEQHQNKMALNQDVTYQVMKQYETKLRECSERVTQAEAKFQEIEGARIINAREVEKLRSQLDQGKTEVKGLEGSQEDLARLLNYLHTIKGLVDLGPDSFAYLEDMLAENGIQLLNGLPDAEIKNDSSSDSSP